MENISTKEFCRRFDACRAGTRFALKFATMRDCYAALLAGEAGEDSAEWAIWTITRTGVMSTRDLRLFAVRCARRVQHLMLDERSVAALDMAERYANGEATAEELKAAWNAAWNAAWATVWGAADAAARAAALAAADAAWATAWATAWNAARNAARAAADAAWDAARAAADAAWATAWATAWNAARNAADAARDEERKAQLDILASFGNPFEVDHD